MISIQQPIVKWKKFHQFVIYSTCFFGSLILLEFIINYQTHKSNWLQQRDLCSTQKVKDGYNALHLIPTCTINEFNKFLYKE